MDPGVLTGQKVIIRIGVPDGSSPKAVLPADDTDADETDADETEANRLAGKRFWSGSMGINPRDRKRAAKALSKKRGRPVSQAELTEAVSEFKQLLARPALRRAVEAVADRLQRGTGRLSGTEVEEIVRF